jgi:hypothetical protein
MRRGNLFWGIMILVMGVLLLLGTTGVLPESINVWSLFWPILLIMMGGWFLLGPLVFRRQAMESEQLSIPRDGAASGRVRLKHGAGKLVVGALSDAGMLLSGSFGGGVESSVHHEGDHIKAKLKLPPQYITLPGPEMFQGLVWNVNLNREIPLRLDVDSGASATELDLTELKVTELNIDTGASSTVVRMPAAAGFTQARIESGAASMQIHIPEGVAARIHVESGLAGVSINSQRFPRGASGYVSADYDSAAHKTEIFIKTSVGSVNIQ